MKVTYQDLLDSRIPAAVGSCPAFPGDGRLLSLTNEGLERLMYEGHYHNTIQHVRFCATDGCITQPPQVAAIEKLAICGQPVTLRTQWHEFMQNGNGVIGTRGSSTSGTGGCCSGNGYGSWCSGNTGVPRGYFCTFSDIVGINKKINLVCDLASDVGKKVLVLGYDQNLNWVRTIQNGVISDGELITLAQSAGTTSTNFFSSWTDTQLNEDRDGQVWGYEYNQDTAIKRMVSQYQAFETRPNYPRWYFEGIRSGTSSNGSCNQTLVDSIVKLNFWPVKVPTDYLCVPCLPALKEVLQSLNDAENEPDGIKKKQLIAAGIISAKATLDKQLQHFTGDGVVPSIEVMGSSIYGNDPVCNLI